MCVCVCSSQVRVTCHRIGYMHWFVKLYVFERLPSETRNKTSFLGLKILFCFFCPSAPTAAADPMSSNMNYVQGCQQNKTKQKSLFPLTLMWIMGWRCYSLHRPPAEQVASDFSLKLFLFSFLSLLDYFSNDPESQSSDEDFVSPNNLESSIQFNG